MRSWLPFSYYSQCERLPRRLLSLGDKELRDSLVPAVLECPRGLVACSPSFKVRGGLFVQKPPADQNATQS